MFLLQQFLTRESISITAEVFLVCIDGVSQRDSVTSLLHYNSNMFFFHALAFAEGADENQGRRPSFPTASEDQTNVNALKKKCLIVIIAYIQPQGYKITNMFGPCFSDHRYSLADSYAHYAFL